MQWIMTMLIALTAIAGGAGVSAAGDAPGIGTDSHRYVVTVDGMT